MNTITKTIQLIRISPDIKHNADAAAFKSIPETIRNGSFDSVFDYIRDIRTNATSTFRSKVLIVGKQAAGKTTLLHCLLPLSGSFSRVQKKMFGAKSIPFSIEFRGPHLMFASEEATYHITLDHTFEVSEVPATEGKLATDNKHTIRIRDTKIEKNEKAMAFVFETEFQPNKDTMFEKISPPSDEQKAGTPTQFDLAFESRETFASWKTRCDHFTGFQITENIDVIPAVLPVQIGKEEYKFETRFLDFAGGNESVSLIIYNEFTHYFIDISRPSSSLSTLDR